MDKLKKLKLGDQVLYWDGSTTMELTKVVQVDKSKSQVKLANGIILHRKSKDGIFCRADYREALEEREKKRRNRSKTLALTSVSQAWKYDSEETSRIWHSYLFKKSFANTYDKLRSKITMISCRDIIYDQESLEFLEEVKRKISLIVC